MQRVNRSRQKRKRRSLDPAHTLLLKQALVGVGLFILVAVIVTAVWYVTRLSAVTVQTVTITGSDTVADVRILEVVEELLDGYYFRLIPKRFSLLYPEQAISAAIMTIPRVKIAEVERISYTELTINIAEHEPFALWCGHDTEACLFLDKTGYAFAKAPELSGGAYIRFTSARQEPVVGAAVLESGRLSQLVDLIEQIPNIAPWLITTVHIESTERAILTTQHGAALRITLAQPTLHTIHYLQALINTEEYLHLQTKPFQYIDLRFGNRLFVNQQSALEVASATTSLNMIPLHESAQTEELHLEQSAQSHHVEISDSQAVTDIAAVEEQLDGSADSSVE